MTTMPSLFLKWRLFREMFDMPRSDREIAVEYWGPNEGPSRFSKMLRGDYTVSPDAAAMLGGVITRRIDTWRAGRGVEPPSGAEPVGAADIGLPLGAFARRMIEYAGAVDADAQDRAHRLAMAELTPRAVGTGAPARLVVERHSRSRVFQPFAEARAEELVRFDPDKDLGQIAVVLDMPFDPDTLAVYFMICRDTASLGERVWDLPFRDVLWWLPSPFVPPVVDGARFFVMAEPQPVLPLPGRYRASVVVARREALARLDLRGAAGETGLFDEAATLRFLTNLGRVQSRSPGSVAVASADYEIAGGTSHAT